MCECVMWMDTECTGNGGDVMGIRWGWEWDSRRMRMLKYFVDNYPKKTCRLVE